MFDDRSMMDSVAGVVERPRLYRVLESSRVRLCVVQGPSGVGKTTLVRSWAARQEAEPPILWISLDGIITSRQAFWQHLLSSAKRMGDLSEKIASRVAEQLNVAADPVRIATGLLADAGPVTLILDAYEHLGDAGESIDEDLARLIRAVPTVRVVVTTRGRTALTDLDLGGEGTVRVISLGELAFTPREVAALMAAQAGVEDDRLARSIAVSTRGYALTVRAAVLALANLGRIPHVDSLEWEAVIAAQLEAQVPEAAGIQFVIDTSVPPYVDVELATELTGDAQAARLLDELERNGFGRWIPYARRRPVFQYVETIRDSFRARAAVDDERFRRCLVATAAWFLENDDIDQALQHAIDGGDYALADRSFVQLVVTNPDSYITDRFLPVLQRAPREVLPRYPMLAFGLGLALLANPALRAEAAEVFQIAIESDAAPSYLDPTVDRFALAGAKAVSLRLVRRFRESADASAEAVRLVEDIDPMLLGQLGEQVGTILRQLSYSLLQGGGIDEALTVMNRSVALCVSPAARNYSLVYAAGANAFVGDIARATSLQATIDTAAWPDGLEWSYMNGLGLVAQGFERLDAMDFAGALDVLRGAESYRQTAEFWPFFTVISVSARHGAGQAQAEAERVTKELAALVPPPGIGDNVATEHLYAVLAHAWIACGRLEEATRLLDGSRPDSPHLASARISVLLRHGDGRRAFRQACELLELPDHTLRSRAAAQTIGALAALNRDETDLAYSWLSSAAVSCETYGTRAHVAVLSPRGRSKLGEFAHECGSASLRRYLERPAGSAQSSGADAVTLTPRESVVLNKLGEHGSIREVAEALVVSPHTVKTQLQAVYRKLGVSSRRAALEAARELGLLEPPGE